MHRHIHKPRRIMKNEGNTTPPKEHSKLPLTDPKEMEIQELLDKGFKIILLKILRATREHR